MSSEPMQRVPYAVSPPRYSVSHQMVTTAFELPNYRVVQNLGVVRGIVVRSRNIFATIGAIAADYRRRQHHCLDNAVRTDEGRCFRDHDSTCDGNWRKCGYRRTLRHH